MIDPGSIAHKLAARDPRLTQAGLQYSRIVKTLTPNINQTLIRLAKQLVLQEQRNPSSSVLQLQTRAIAAVSSALKGGAGIPPGADIEELAFIVLMNATNDMDNDLQEIMNEVQAQTQAKNFLRSQMQIVSQDVANNSVGTNRFRDALVASAAKLVRHR